MKDLADTIEATGFKVSPAVIDDSIDPAEAPETPNNAGVMLASDPPTLVDAPKGRRSARRS